MVWNIQINQLPGPIIPFHTDIAGDHDNSVLRYSFLTRSKTDIATILLIDFNTMSYWWFNCSALVERQNFYIVLCRRPKTQMYSYQQKILLFLLPYILYVNVIWQLKPNHTQRKPSTTVGTKKIKRKSHPIIR